MRRCDLRWGFLAVLMVLLVPAGWAADWYPSKWGAEDEIGAANLITPERVLAAAKLVTKGKVYALVHVQATFWGITR
ncbi:MAG: hypothetical protein KatS3mg131_0150 [Candidatus Tectimicrobiota bacterium]|nr:MAG: hypothetical protein KatS3mg131_0150 [Candidatus Tectomicrobia bacterium]